MSSKPAGFSETPKAQLRLLVSVLPELREEGPLALKGGSAINLFHQDLPRLSVDLDLVYLPSQPREAALEGIGAELERMAQRLESRRLAVQRVRPAGSVHPLKLVVRGEATIKLEVSPVLRGTVFGSELRESQPFVTQQYGYARVPLVSKSDLYAGKIMAALDRQHPRDLFDIRGLLQRGGLKRPLMKAFLVYLISHDRPISEILNPHFKDLSGEFQTQFVGLTREPVTLNELLDARAELLRQIYTNLTSEDRAFLRSFKALEPRWDLLGLPEVEHLPAVRWKLFNLHKMSSRKHREALEKLTRTLETF